MSTTQQVVSPAKDLLTDTMATSPRRRYLRYFLAFSIMPVLVWLSAFPLVCAKNYEQWSESQWGPMLEYPYLTSTPNADVVIFGDSSAFLGIDPRLVNAQLGIKSLVLPSTVGSLPVMGDSPLRFYLAHHQQPKLIVLYFGAWNLDFAHLTTGRVFEGEEMMMRHGTWGEILHYELRHPLEFLEFPLRVYSSFGQKMVTAILLHRSRAKDTFAALGHAPYTELFGSLTNTCRFPQDFLDRTGQQTVADLKQRFQTPTTQVMVYLAPIPNCTNSADIRNRNVSSLGAAPPALLPPTDFAADPYYAHISPPFVPDATQAFTDALRQKLQTVAPELLHSNDSLAGAR